MKMSKTLTVADVMTAVPLVTIGKEELVAQAAWLMRENRISALPVVAEGRIVGIITTDDILLAGSMSKNP